MHITYDSEADAVSIRFFPGETATTTHVNDDIAIDFTADGRVANIEILSASGRIGDLEVLKKALFADITNTSARRTT